VGNECSNVQAYYKVVTRTNADDISIIEKIELMPTHMQILPQVQPHLQFTRWFENY
jgi:hypothetical protein